MVAAREWETYGMPRPSGFTRASYTAAAQILICYLSRWNTGQSRAGVARRLLGSTDAAIYYDLQIADACRSLVAAHLFPCQPDRRDSPVPRAVAGQRPALMAFWLLLVFAGPFLAP
ncbi:MAG: hypothetical protein IPI83_07755 [Sphingomonadales bacterium]|nr:hypothetical protein [Sphingomonadales bacterium]